MDKLTKTVCRNTDGFSGNRTSLTSTGSENYTIEYVYDANNRLTTETKSAGTEGNVTSYTYDANGNTLTKSVVDGESGISGTTYEYNLIGQQTKSTTNGRSINLFLQRTGNPHGKGYV